MEQIFDALYTAFIGLGFAMVVGIPLGLIYAKIRGTL